MGIVLPKGFTVVSSTLNTTNHPPAVSKMIEYLDGLKMGELVDLSGISEAVGMARAYLASMTSFPVLDDYQFKLNATRTYWGNKQTIAKLRAANGQTTKS